MWCVADLTDDYLEKMEEASAPAKTYPAALG
jgi:hypothetical protein